MIKLKVQNYQKGFTHPSSRAGFTLVETLVVIFVFSITVLVVVCILVKAMQIERRSFASQAIQDNVLAVLELMSKEIRVSTISNQDNNCSGTASNTLTIIHPNVSTGNLETIIYRLTSGVVTKEVVGDYTYLLSSNDVVFNSLGFCVLGTTTPFDNKATRVTILLSVSSTIGGQNVMTKIQTTVTSRNTADELQN